VPNKEELVFDVEEEPNVGCSNCFVNTNYDTYLLNSFIQRQLIAFSTNAFVYTYVYGISTLLPFTKIHTATNPESIF
jgi:hypothetical protein